MGQLFAHHLRQAGVEVTLLLRSAEALRTFDGNITLYRREPRPPRTGAEAEDNIGTFGPPSVSTGFRAEVAGAHGGSPIHRLLITLKAQQTVGAVRQLRPRLHGGTRIVLLQNGMGVVEELAESGMLSLAADGIGGRNPGETHSGLTGSTGPQVFVGVATHGCTRDAAGPFTIRHNTLRGEGAVDLGPAGRLGAADEAAGCSTLSELALALAGLNATVRSAAEVRAKQRAKLVANCCINPITALLDCRNGQLATDGYARDLMAEVCRECVAALWTGETGAGTSRSPVEAERLAGEALQGVIQVASLTAGNISSMLQDVRAGRETEVDYLNGYVVRRAAPGGAPTNATLLRLIKAKTAANK
eukprot:jgi/Tetstr1/424200/TSEL_014806.t1